MRVRVRYDLPDENGETRRERSLRFGVEDNGPNLDIPAGFYHLWEWYWTISARLRRVRDGVAEPIPPSEFTHWCHNSGTIIRPVEYAILSAMDDVFCDEMNLELRDYRLRENERSRKEAEANKPKSKRGRK